MKSQLVFLAVIAFMLSSILSFIAFYLLMMRVDKYLNYQAMNNCAKIATFKKNDTKSDPGVAYELSYPLQDVYSNCLKQIK